MASEKILDQYSNKTESLPTILSSHGYRTVFISPHGKNENLRYLMKATGFHEVYSADDYIPGTNDFLTDKNLYKFLYMKAKELDSGQQPFLLVAYIVGTHHGLDSPDKKWSNGRNSYFNKFHNSDYWFGDFVKKIESSGMGEDTTIVYTADHSTFPTQEYRDTFGSNAHYFIDRIPLIFYKPSMKSERFDAKNRNSLCLTPTILDYLGIKDERNHFLGESLFSKENNEFSRLSVIGDDYYSTVTGSAQLIKEEDINKKTQKKVRSYYDFAG